MTRLRIMTPPVRPGWAGLAAACVLAAAGAGCGASAGGPGAGTPTPLSSASSLAADPASARPSGSQCCSVITATLSPAVRKALAARYLAIAQPANHRLDVENDGYGDDEHDDLAGARTDLLDEIATETQFDRQLLAIGFPAPIEAQVQALVTANKARIALTRRQAGATTLAALRAFDSQHQASDAAVEAPVRQIRRLLGLPPPETS
jgi:hypothetical protein